VACLLDQTFSLEMGCYSLFRNGQLFALVIIACCFSLLLQARFVPGLVFRDSSSLFTISSLWASVVDLGQCSCLRALYLPSGVYAMNEMLPFKKNLNFTIDVFAFSSRV
jgi:hypothetical protein